MDASLSVYGVKRVIPLTTNPIKKAQEHRNLSSKFFNVFIDKCSFGYTSLEKKRNLERETETLKLLSFLNSNIEDNTFVGMKLLYTTKYHAYDTEMTPGYCIIQHYNEIKLHIFALKYGPLQFSLEGGELLLKFNNVTEFAQYKKKLEDFLENKDVKLDYHHTFKTIKDTHFKWYELRNLQKIENQLVIKLSSMKNVDDAYSNSEAKLLIDNFIERTNNDKFIDVVNFKGKNIDVSYPTYELINKHKITLEPDFFSRAEFSCLKESSPNTLERLQLKYLEANFILEDIPDEDKILSDVLASFDSDKYRYDQLPNQNNPLYTSNHTLSLQQQVQYNELINLITEQIVQIQKTFITMKYIRDNKIYYKNMKVNSDRYGYMHLNLQGESKIRFNDGRLMVHDSLYDRVQMLSLLLSVRDNDQENFINRMANIVSGFPNNLIQQRIAFKEIFTYLYVSKNFPNKGVRNAYLHFLLRCGQLF